MGPSSQLSLWLPSQVLSSTQAALPFPRHLAMPVTFLLVTMGEGRSATGLQWIEARDAAKHPTVQTQPPPQRIIWSKISVQPFPDFECSLDVAFTEDLFVLTQRNPKRIFTITKKEKKKKRAERENSAQHFFCSAHPEQQEWPCQAPFLGPTLSISASRFCSFELHL